MLQKFALAFKSKTIEFFADDEDSYADDEILTVDLDPAPEEIISDQRVVVIKPDLPHQNPNLHLQTLVSSLFATVSSFHAAYLHLQTAHFPFQLDSIAAADRAAVSHLRRLSDLKHAFHHQQNPNPNPNLDLPLSTHLEAHVQENQSLLRTFDTVINRLQSDIDRKDAEAAALKQQLCDIEEVNSKLERRLDRACSPPDQKVEFLLSVGVFDAVLRDACRAVHGFTRVLIDLMKGSGWDLVSVANSIHPDVNYAKAGHFRYAILSYVFLELFRGFDSCEFRCNKGGRIESNGVDVSIQRRDSLRQFIEHSSVDALELLSGNPSCGFARFCEDKYQQLIKGGMEPSLFGSSDCRETLSSSWQPSGHLHESFVNMSSSIWMLHKLAWAYDPVVEIFKVEQGTDFSIVYMESVVRRAALNGSGCGKTSRPKVGFTVVPGFRVGKTVIQCRVYLDGGKHAL